MYLMTGLWTLPALPVLGILRYCMISSLYLLYSHPRDATGEYRWSFLGLAASLGLGTSVWGLEPWLRKYGQKENKVDI